MFFFHIKKWKFSNNLESYVYSFIKQVTFTIWSQVHILDFISSVIFCLTTRGLLTAILMRNIFKIAVKSCCINNHLMEQKSISILNNKELKRKMLSIFLDISCIEYYKVKYLIPLFFTFFKTCFFQYINWILP